MNRVREFAGGGSVAVAVGVSDMCQVTGYTQHVISDTIHVTQVRRDRYQMVLGNCQLVSGRCQEDVMLCQFKVLSGVN